MTPHGAAAVLRLFDHTLLTHNQEMIRTEIKAGSSLSASLHKDNAATTEPVRILCAANATYAASLCVMLVSLLINFARDREIEIYVLATNIPEEDRRKIETSLRENSPHFRPSSLHWLSPTLDVLQGLHLSDWAKVEVYARLLAPHVLPENFDKVLYLDSDMVVLSDVSQLYDLPCGDSAVLASRDENVGFVSEELGVFNFSDLGIDPKAGYFNSGVLLINLRYWREKNVTERVIDYLKLHESSVKLWDQGGLNAILHNAWTEIDPTWNQMHSVLLPYRWKQLGRSRAEWTRVKNHPKIVHYTGEAKPWLTSELPRYSYFFNYLAKTRYRNAFKGPRFERIVGFRFNFFLWHMKMLLFWKRSPQDLMRVLKRTLSPQASVSNK